MWARLSISETNSKCRYEGVCQYPVPRSAHTKIALQVAWTDGANVTDCVGSVWLVFPPDRQDHTGLCYSLCGVGSCTGTMWQKVLPMMILPSKCIRLPQKQAVAMSVLMAYCPQGFLNEAKTQGTTNHPAPWPADVSWSRVQRSALLHSRGKT